MLNPQSHQPYRSYPPKFYAQDKSLGVLVTALLLCGGMSPWLVPALADTLAGTEIRNTAVGAFEDPDNLGAVVEVTSNEVVVTVAEVAGIVINNGPTAVVEAPNTVTGAGPSQDDGDINPEDVVYFTFTLINVGNDATQFFIPNAPSAITGGTLADDIQLMAYDPDGTGTSIVDLTGNNITVPASGATTGTLLNGIAATNDGSVLRNGSITIRVPIKIDAGLNDGDTVTVVMGDTPAPPNASRQNQPYSAGIRDIYTHDNLDGATEEAAGDPMNGDTANHRQEASSSQEVPVGVAIGDISGRAWQDDNGNGLRDAGETGIDSIVVELFDTNGVSQGITSTAGGGLYNFLNLPVGDYVVQFTPPPNFTVAPIDQGVDDTVDSDVKLVVNQTNPVSVVNGVVTEHVDLGLVPDSDNDSATDPEEGTGDSDGDGTPDFLDFDPTGYFYDEATGEIIPGGLVTINGDEAADQLNIYYDGSTGYYQWLGEVPGVYTQTIILPPGYEFSDTCLLRPLSDIFDPTGGPSPTVIGAYQDGNTGFLQNTTCAPSYLVFDLEPGDPIVINNNIPLKAITASQDYGDAPDTGIGTGVNDYQTVAIDNGPIHTLGSGISLGSTVTTDTDGGSFSGTAGSNGDATDDTGDDGVRLNSNDLQGQTLTAGESVTLDITTQGSGVLNAWIDWNGDGDFLDTDEQISSDANVSGGTLNVAVPFFATVGTTYARFRYSSDTGLGPTGTASNGEVEDYQVAIAPNPTIPTPPSSCVFDGTVWYNTSNRLYTYDTFTNTNTLQTNLARAYGDIAWGVDGNLYGIDFTSISKLYQIDPTTGQGTAFPTLPFDVESGNSLSGDNLGWLYFGSGESGTSAVNTYDNEVTLRHNIYTGVSEQWIDFGDYGFADDRPSGDFIFIDGFAYVAWANNFDTSLVTVELLKVGPLGSNNEAIATTTVTSLGALPTNTFGLAGNDTGNIFAFSGTGNKIYRVEVSPFAVTEVGTLSDLPFGSSGEFESYGVTCTSPATNAPDVLLVKRITRINNSTTNLNDNTDLTQVVNDNVANSSDDHSNWPTNYLIGELNAGLVKPGDEIEYTVYFLNAGSADAGDVRICDWIQPNQSFVAGLYGSNDIELQQAGSTYNLTATSDVNTADRAELATVGSLPAGPTCNLPAAATNNSDAVLVLDVTGTVGNPTGLPTVPGSTGQGTPNNSYGLFRFTTKVDE
ncbi:hypothetical protein IQ260_06965 [Leptolyngbya cf. ectocarpi LEGE 11479]|uniref:DUF11 domain-containing protein n=1 Tax=Leptolyngbya cf. ectocarpi LEGE 11479 TaxID=1828722 RepID=A0A928WZP0_LEPEC|nr:SdrD B-like domain-containing protein [Leptolyngbya ectocarpi]MBE9066390.1 hypothetical protein [Leptolyngbya cf. ectocarpi LEGE 11479]